MPTLPDRTPPTLAAIHAARVKSAWRGRGSTFIAASEAAQECARAIWMNFRWASPSETASARMLRLFATGDMEERRILSDLEAIPGVALWRVDAETGKQWKAIIAGYIAVKPDAVALGLPEAPKSPHVIECKTANDKNFAAIKSKGAARAKPDHWLQAQLEMHGMGVKRTLYFAVNKNTDEEYVERIKVDAEATDRAIARLVSIAEAPRPPARFRETPDKPPCLFCRHKGICHDGAAARVNCRTCVSSSARPGGIWWCEHHGRELTPEAQAEGCPDHLWVPDLVAGEQIDVSPEARTVTYRMRSGEVWVDGQAEKAREVAL